MQSHQRPAPFYILYGESTIQQTRAFPHRYQTDAMLPGLWHESFSVVFHFQVQSILLEAHPHLGLARTGVSHNIIQGLLQDAVGVNSRAALQ